MHAYCLSWVLKLMFMKTSLEFVCNWTTFGFWFLKLIFETCHIMSLQVVSRKLAQNDQIWCSGIEFWAWGSNLEIPNFGLTLERRTPRSSVHTGFIRYARAGKMTLEREFCVSSTLPVFTVRSSGVMHARVRTCVSLSSGYRAPIERDFHTFGTFAVRSSRKVYALAEAFVCMSARAG